MPISDLTHREQGELLQAIALREGTARELCAQYGCTRSELSAFAALNSAEIEQLAAPQPLLDNELSPTELKDLWITNKFERIKRLQAIADNAFRFMEDNGATDSTLLREFRSYLALVANELGQLLHRGSGDTADGDMVSYSIEGVDMEKLR